MSDSPLNPQRRLSGADCRRRSICFPFVNWLVLSGVCNFSPESFLCSKRFWSLSWHVGHGRLSPHFFRFV